ncbi:MAG: hypothetical protein M1334_00600 [Patescibacteria group bacterium]|nr:hypothetical protein [Patescibacteria group bacterium]
MKITRRAKTLYYRAMTRLLMNKLINAMLVKIAALVRPWTLARFYAAWEEYQKGPVYRERAFEFGMHHAIMAFIEDKWTRDYCLKIRLNKEPNLKWRLIFTPFAIEAPSILVIAAESGLFRSKS